VEIEIGQRGGDINEKPLRAKKLGGSQEVAL
jgi:hypothetical protein